MKLFTSDFIQIANDCGIAIADDYTLLFDSSPAVALYEFYKAVSSVERKLILETLGNLIERERAARSA